MFVPIKVSKTTQGKWFTIHNIKPGNLLECGGHVRNKTSYIFQVHPVRI
jgi:hypothetical protein